MKCYYYTVESIPDLSLSKYTGIDNTGVEGIISRHSIFLKQLHAIGMRKNVSFHLFYVMDSNKEKGRRLSIVFMLREYCLDESIDSSGYYLSLINSSALSTFYKFVPLNIENMDSKDSNSSLSTKKYSTQVFISRKASVKSSKESYTWNKDKPFYISEWEGNDNGRLYNFLKLIERIGTDIVYRVDLFPKDYTEKIIDETTEYLSLLKKNSYSSGGGIGAKRDELSENAHKRLKSFIGNLTDELHFSANISVLSNDESTSEIVLQYVVSEIVNKGEYSTCCITGDFNWESNIDEEIGCTAVENFERYRFLQNLYGISILKGFFSFPALYDNENVEFRKETDPSLDCGDISLGQNQNGYHVYVPLEAFNKHAYISGIPGSGKTWTMKHLISSLYKNNINFIVFEPAKSEYRGLFVDCSLFGEKFVDDVLFFSPSACSHFPLQINPFEISDGITVTEHISNLVSVFEGAFDLPSPVPYIINEAIELVYLKNGWRFFDRGSDNVIKYGRRKGEKKKIPTLSEMYSEYEKVLDTKDYDGDIKGNCKSILQTRIGSLLTREMGEVFDVQYSTIAPQDWVNKSAIVELESLGEGPANFLTLLISTVIRESLKTNPTFDEKKVRHVMFFEEAHNLIGPIAETDSNSQNTNAKSASTKFIVKMLAEVRALKEGIVIADQLPSSIASQVLKNTGLKIAHRQLSLEERQLLSQVMSASPVQTERIAQYSTGQALISYESVSDNNINKPFEVQIETLCKFSGNPNNDDLIRSIGKTRSHIYILYKAIDNLALKYFYILWENFNALRQYDQKIAMLSDFSKTSEINNYKKYVKEIRNISMKAQAIYCGFKNELDVWLNDIGGKDTFIKEKCGNNSFTMHIEKMERIITEIDKIDLYYPDSVDDFILEISKHGNAAFGV